MIFNILFLVIFFTFITIFLFKFLSNSSFKRYISLENIPTEFENIYENLYRDHISSLELLRKKIIRMSIFVIIFDFLFLIGFIFIAIKALTYATGSSSISLIIVSLFIIVPMLFLVYRIRNYKNKYINSYTEEILPEFIKLVNSQLNYKTSDIELYSIEYDYVEANFDNQNYNSFNADDYISGFLDNETFVKMSDLTIQYISNEKDEYKYDIFRGIFAHTKCNKDIETYIKVSLNELTHFDKKDRIEMDSAEFEKYFDIYSDNKIVAMQILTSDIMQFLTDFYMKYKLKYEIVFKNNSIYMRFFTGSMFEPTIFKNSVDKKVLFMYYCIMNFIIDILKKVNKTLQDTEI